MHTKYTFCLIIALFLQLLTLAADSQVHIQGLTPLSLPGDEQWTQALKNKHIALWPSHGTYYNQAQQLWRWQRATMWTTVEDLYTTAYTTHITRMLERSGAVVLQPRPRLNGRDLKQVNGHWVFRCDSDAYRTGRSGMQRWQESASEWLRYAGFPDSIYDYFQGQDNYKSDIHSRGRWVNYLAAGSPTNPTAQGLGIPIDLCLALHTDGLSNDDNVSTVGTLAIYYTRGNDDKRVFPSGQSRLINKELATQVHSQIVQDIRALYCPEWSGRKLRDANYGEARIPEVPTVLIELLSHKNMPDMIFGLDPRFRFDASRAVYKGILRFLHAQSGTSPVIQPLPVRNCQVQILTDDSLCLSWTPTTDPLEPTATPTYYVVYYRLNDGQWQYSMCDTTYYTHKAQRGTRYDYYIVAGNTGGISYESETLSAYLAPQVINGDINKSVSAHSTKKHNKLHKKTEAAAEPPTVLIVNAFNHVGGPLWFRDSTYAGIVPGSYPVEDGSYCAYIGDQVIFDRRIDWTDDDNCGFGMCNRDMQTEFTLGNTHNYPSQHGRVLASMGISYVSANVSTVRTLDPKYTAVDIIFSKQPASASSPLIDSTLRRAISNYLAQHGRLLISGSYLGSGMSSPSLTRWTEQQLHYRFRAPRACHNGQLSIEQNWLNCTTAELWQHPSPTHLFAESPESLDPTGDAVRLGCYADMRIPFGSAWKSYVSRRHPDQTRTVVFGFPLECSPQFTSLYSASINYLLQTDSYKKSK